MTIDLTTHYGSLKLRSPVIVGACRLTNEEQSRIAIISAGAGAIVLPSLFEEQVAKGDAAIGPSTTSASRLHVAPAFTDADQYLEAVRRASQTASIPVIASLSGRGAGNWLEFARQLEGAGAAGVELNVYPSNPNEFDGPRAMEEQLIEFVTTIDTMIEIPLFLKLHRQFTSISHLARRLLSGVQGITLFGRLPVVDVRLDEPGLHIEWGLSAPGSVSDSIRSIMQVHAFCPAMSLAATGGIGNSCDLVKVLLAGADVGMVVSAVYRDGPNIIRSMLDGLVAYMESHHLKSLDELKATRPLRFDTEEERADYIQALSSRPLPSEIARSGDRVIHGDRWGHPTQ